MARQRRERFAAGKAISEGAIVVANARMRATAEEITGETLEQLLEGLRDHKNTRDLGRLCVVLRTMVPFVGKLKDAVPVDGEDGQPRTFEDLKAALKTLPPAEQRELRNELAGGSDEFGDFDSTSNGSVEVRLGPTGKRINQWGVESDDPEVGGPHPAVFEDIK